MDVLQLLRVWQILALVLAVGGKEGSTNVDISKTNGKNHLTWNVTKVGKSANPTTEWISGSSVKSQQNVRERGKEPQSFRLVKRSAVRDSGFRWKNKTVPLYFSRDFNGSRDYITSAIGVFKNYTCVLFTPGKISDRNRVRVESSGCTARIGMIGGEQEISLQPNCETRKDVLRLLSSTLGLISEIQRPDRDIYINVFFGNILPTHRDSFRTYSAIAINTYGVPYDYRSITHPHAQEFALDGKATFAPKDSAYRSIVGDTHGLSFRNIKVLNLMYKCDEYCTSKPVCPGEGFVGKDCKCWCPGNPIIYCEKDPNSTAVCPDGIVTILGWSGMIYSPGFLIRNGYPNLSVCRWRIEAINQNDIIRLDIAEYETEEHYDYLTLHDGSHASDPLLANLSGTLPSQSYSSTGPKMFLQFIASNADSRRGFSIRYTMITKPSPTACSKGVAVLTDTSGHIYSPGFGSGQNYSHDTDCQWLITAANPLDVIRLEIKVFDTEKTHDKLAVHDGAGACSRLLARLSGVVSSRVFSSTGPQMFITFTTDGSRSSLGFSMSYVMVRASSQACRNGVKLLNGVTGNVYSPGFVNGQNYSHNVVCQWLITAAYYKNIIKLKVKIFGTETFSDYLAIHDGASPVTGLLAYISGVDSHKVYSSTGPQMFINFTTDLSISGRGFSMSYSTVRASSQACSNGFLVLRNTSGQIYSPGFLTGQQYKDREVCRWLITAAHSRIIRLTIRVFDTERRHDRLAVHDGAGPGSRLLAQLSGAVSYAVYTSTGPQMLINFTTNISRRRRGFSLRYVTITGPFCSGGLTVLNKTKGSIYTPGYPSGQMYTNSELCNWLIQAPSPNIVRLDVIYFRTQKCCDFLKIYDKKRAYRLGTLSGVKSAQVYYSTGSQMFLRFTTDRIGTERGFFLRYDTSKACPSDVVKVQGTSGKIFSPGFEAGMKYNNRMECQWRISAQLQTSIIQLEVTKLDTESCCDFLKLYNGPRVASPQLASLSGNITKRYYYSTGSEMLLRFTTDSSATRYGFLLRYTVLKERNIECTFETRCNDLELSQLNSSQWNMASSTSNVDTGPVGDHTFNGGRGKFVYAVASSENMGMEAYGKISPPVVATVPFYCIKFWYHMSGLDVGGLWVNYSILQPSQNMTILWREGSQGRYWLKEEEDLDIKIGSLFTISFRIWKGRGERGDIAIDDLSLLPGRCQQGIWSHWSDWACLVTCGTGDGLRFRNCSRGRCQGHGSQTRLCYKRDCPATWEQWSSWALCPVTCGSGISTRNRTCRGNNCTGPATDLAICKLSPCPGIWGPWRAWMSCTASCGSGLTERTRSCKGTNCFGKSTAVRICTRPACQGAWTLWTQWTCDVTCGYGIRRRLRRCVPRSASCSGPPIETDLCDNLASCKED